MSFVPIEVSKMQAGDQILVQSKVWTVKGFDGPDRVGTYDLYLQDDHGVPALAIASEFVTMVR